MQGNLMGRQSTQRSHKKMWRHTDQKPNKKTKNTPITKHTNIFTVLMDESVKNQEK